MGYRISPEERDEGGYRLPDMLAFVDTLIAEGIDYLHASLHEVLVSRPQGSSSLLTVEHLIAHVGDRVPLMAAGALRTPEQAESALALGLSAVAVGKGLVMNQDWVALARSGNDAAIRQALDVDRRIELAIPEGLWRAVEASPGWIPVSQ